MIWKPNKWILSWNRKIRSHLRIFVLLTSFKCKDEFSLSRIFMIDLFTWRYFFAKKYLHPFSFVIVFSSMLSNSAQSFSNISRAFFPLGTVPIHHKLHVKEASSKSYCCLPFIFHGWKKLCEHFQLKNKNLLEAKPQGR